MLLNKQPVTIEIKKPIKVCLKMNANKNMTTQNLWDSGKAVLRWMFIAIQAYLKKQELRQIKDQPLYPKQLEKEQQQQKKTHNVSRRKEIVKIWTEINENEMKVTIAKINKTISLYFKKIHYWQTDSHTHEERKEDPNQ